MSKRSKYEMIKHYIDVYDYLDLRAGGAPNDEFDTYSSILTGIIKDSDTPEDIAKHIANAMDPMFGEVVRPDKFIATAEKIYTAMHDGSVGTDELEFMKGEGNVPVSSFVIFLLQEKYNVKFPEGLKKFYYEHNGEKSYLCTFGTDRQYEISRFLPLTGKISVESIKDNDLVDGFIPEELVPFSMDRGGDFYYWSNKDAKIYLVRGDNIENPRLICDSFEELCDILNRSEIRK